MPTCEKLWSIRLDRRTAERLEELAERRGRPRSEEIRAALRNHVRRSKRTRHAVEAPTDAPKREE